MEGKAVMGKQSFFLCLLLISLLIFNSSALAAAEEKIELNDQSINLENDEQIMELKEEIEKKSEIEKDMIIGSTVVFLNGEEDQIRSRESNLGNLITDAIVNKAKVHLAVINSRTINSSINKGLINIRNIREVLPAKDEVIIKKIKGSELLKALKHGVSKYPDTASFFPQLSGIKLIFAEVQNGENEILRASINYEQIKKDKNYLIATNDFLADGGDGYEEFKEAEKIENAGRLDQIFIDYLKQQEIIEEIQMNRIIPVRKKDGNYVYQVKQGDYLYLIAQKFSTTVKEIMAANGLENRSLIFQGQELIIPHLR